MGSRLIMDSSDDIRLNIFTVIVDDLYGIYFLSRY